ncbi:hypothetical protein RCL_jg15797.t1 [Rhizophagus clarus]|uniref:Uncharacterized protein n=1 Tax=Rhizophagus clarus TaxID=94130 RepID=A0A8H3MCK0_9GLOM|nr:hypothetical protein RCL_jg15797.t1 [Rhizophagus clarus]
MTSKSSVRRKKESLVDFEITSKRGTAEHQPRIIRRCTVYAYIVWNCKKKCFKDKINYLVPLQHDLL